MSITLSQAGRALQAKTPLGPDVLVPISLEGEEEVSRPYRFEVDFVSTDLAVAASALLGKPVGLKIALPEGGTRLVHGVVRRFAHLGVRRDLARYRAELVPALRLLEHSSDCRTFEDKSVLDIVKQVCNAAGVSDITMRTMGTYKPLPYVVQYRETNLDFVQRLLDEAGLYYAFEHAEDKHTLVISDAHGGSIPAGALPTVRVGVLGAGEYPLIDTVSELAREYAVHAGKVQLADHALLRADSRGQAQSSHPGATGTLVDFLGDLGPNDSSGEARLWIEQEEAAHDTLVGTSTCASFTAGTRVKLTGGFLGAAGVEVHLLKVSHHLQQSDIIGGDDVEATYQNRFECIPASVPYRPEADDDWEHPSVRGTQTAKVVGTGGAGEIDVDADGCVLLQFPWDTGAGKDGKSKHRVHLASVWAGAGWGFVQLPRIGQEVLVEFLEGDPARPIVTGRVYNSASKFPYDLPANKTQAGWKSRTLGGGADNFNELRFEDKKGSEHVFLQAEKDLQVQVKHDETRNVGNDRASEVGNDETWTIGRDRAGTVGRDQTLSVGRDVTTTISRNSTASIGKNLSLAVAENRTTDVGKDDALTIGGSLAADVAKKITIEAGDQITLKCGQSTITMKKDGTITVKGKDLVLDAMSKVDIKANAQVQIKGAKLAAEGSAQAEFKGAMVKLEGQAMTTIKGAIAQVTGDGMLKGGGGITMLG